MRDIRASSVTPDPCPHFMWSEVGHLSVKGLICKSTAKALKRSLGAQDFCRGDKSLIQPKFNLSQFRTVSLIPKTAFSCKHEKAASPLMIPSPAKPPPFGGRPEPYPQREGSRLNLNRAA